VNVRPREGEGVKNTVGLVFSPPHEHGASFIPLFAIDQAMLHGLRAGASVLAGLLRRLSRAYLTQLTVALADPLSSVDDDQP
jgi:hypothetical protein